MLAGGTTTIEIKTGYALTTEGELGLLDTIARAAKRVPVQLVPTLLAHLVPPERRADRDLFVRGDLRAMDPARRGTQHGGYGVRRRRRCMVRGRRVHARRDPPDSCSGHRRELAVRGHVGQLSDVGGAELFAEVRARSVDHLEYVSDAAVAALARAGTVAVMLPGACVQLRLPPPPIAKLRAAGVAMAIATDLNPGTSWSEHPRDADVARDHALRDDRRRSMARRHSPRGGRARPHAMRASSRQARAAMSSCGSTIARSTFATGWARHRSNT